MNKKTMHIFDVNKILRTLPYLDLTSMTADMEMEEGNDGDEFPMQASFETGGLYIGGFVGLTPWENHPDMDEFLYAVDGEVEITILTESGSQTELLKQECACIISKGLWHRQLAHQPVRLLSITGRTLVSWDDDPRSA